jgi:iron complex transport system substrate-binding protein
MNMRRKRHRVALAIVSSLAAFFAGLAFSGPSMVGAAGSAYPVTIHAANGAVTVAHRPTAIVSLSPTATEMLFAIGAGSQVKAVDSYSDYPLNAPRTNLNAYDPSVEAIVAYKPDLVVVSNFSTGASGLERQLAKFSIPVLYDPSASTLAQEYQQFDQLGEATGHLAQAKHEVRGIKAQLGGIVKHAPRHRAGQTYYFELEPNYYSVASSTFVGQVLGLLGLKSIADGTKGVAAESGYPQLSAEYIIKANHDYIFLADTICCGQSAKTVEARPGWSTLTAVKQNHVVALNDDIASRWGPRIVILLRDVAQSLAQGSGHNP